MARKRYKPEEIVAKLRQVDVLVSQGQGMTEAIRQIGVSDNVSTVLYIGYIGVFSRAEQRALQAIFRND